MGILRGRHTVLSRAPTRAIIKGRNKGKTGRETERKRERGRERSKKSKSLQPLDEKKTEGLTKYRHGELVERENLLKRIALYLTPHTEVALLVRLQDAVSWGGRR